MLLRNYSYINQICGHTHSGITNPIKFMRPHVMRGYYCQQNTDNLGTIKIDSFPTGSSQPYSYIIADTAGLITATTTLFQSNGFENLNLAGGLNGESAWDGTSTFQGELGALAYLITSITGENTLSGDIQGVVLIAADLAGTGNLSGALGALVSILADLNGDGELNGSISGALSAVSTLAGNGDLTGAIQGVVEILSSFTGTNTLTSAIIGNWDMAVSLSGTNTINANISAIADLISSLVANGTIVLNSGAVAGAMNANITSLSELSPESLASSLWNSVASQYNLAGTMGAKLNAAGNAANPWDEVISGDYTAREVMELLLEIALQEGGVSSLTLQQIEQSLILAKENTVIGLY